MTVSRKVRDGELTALDDGDGDEDDDEMSPPHDILASGSDLAKDDLLGARRRREDAQGQRSASGSQRCVAPFDKNLAQQSLLWSYSKHPI